MAPARDRRTGFSRRRQYGAFLAYVLAVAGAVVGAVLLVASTFNPPAFAALRMTLGSVTAPISGTFVAIGDAISGVPDTIGHYFFVHSENDRLRAELEQSRKVLLTARTIAQDNRRLRRLLAVRDRTPDTIVTARLVSSTGASGRRFALLNAGRWQGVEPGMAVRGPEGLIGRVTESGPAAARVLLLTDPESIVPVRRTRDGMPAIAVGRGDGTLDVRSVATNVRLGKGDLFVTSGTGGLYAPNIPVARVRTDGGDVAVARPFIHPDTLDFAIVQRAFMPMPPSAPAPRP
ncbi:rod shape-determining protein MreC [Sphingomonas parapaucimobilis]|uniref:Cell shape-determining protein MreC n=1 Tax=Sphingomonas parapaucimobilis NBRC 15100 TaxID=1219049 RepID=A0A0A1W2U2_9SPHN|nr:rod shape-determining protein MreC [Sphingomonas parapaucimobilis]GAL99521.1 rod shape-determining protein MreC [Sphingomonas parapaucimobilis NBRC 15100]